jgi:uncharacterized protein YndB with AHSA1/START domain
MSRDPLNVAVSIDAPPEKVFEVLCDVEHWPEWTPTMISVERLDTGPFRVGSSARIRQPKLRPTVWRVTDLEDNRSFTWVTSGPGFRMRAGHSVRAAGAGSHVELSFEITGFMAPLLSLLYGGLTREYVTTESQKLKARSESAAG